ncbi:hypothetical protein ICG_03144 [Bacillus cereus BAG1X1-3]|nr:hypothetical protein ICG_03144 [Bacillus cereus BAG1X1-3]
MKTIILGRIPTLMVPTTVLVAVAITEIVLLNSFATYARLPFGETVIPCGAIPTLMVPTTVLVAALITETVLLP